MCSTLLLLLLPVGALSFSVPGLDAYTASLAVHPLSTKVCTAGVLAIGGDAIAQSSDPELPYDRKRAVSFALFDAAYRGGFQHAAFPWIIEHCRGNVLQGAAASLALPMSTLPPPDALAAVECTAFNQLLLVPVVYYPLFFGITGAVQGLTLEQAIARAQERFVPLTLRNWQFWIPAQFVQFAFIDVEWQVPYTCAMGLVWNILLSGMAGSARPAVGTGVITPTGSAETVGVVEPVRSAADSKTGIAKDE